LIENSDAIACQEVGTSGTSKESDPGIEKVPHPLNNYLHLRLIVTLPLLLLVLAVERLGGRVNLVFQ